jgi:hypothetical protein
MNLWTRLDLRPDLDQAADGLGGAGRSSANRRIAVTGSRSVAGPTAALFGRCYPFALGVRRRNEGRNGAFIRSANGSNRSPLHANAAAEDDTFEAVSAIFKSGRSAVRAAFLSRVHQQTFAIAKGGRRGGLSLASNSTVLDLLVQEF